MFELDRWILVPRGNGATCFGRLKGEVKERSDVPYIYLFIYIYRVCSVCH